MPAMPKKKKEEIDQREVLYPTLTVNGIPIPLEKMKLSALVIRDLLGWETEEHYKKEMEASDDPEDKARGKAGYGDEYLVTDTAGRKVRCHNNLDNRPFDLVTMEKLCQTILNRQWAGPTTFPGETVNGETIIIGRTGKVESAQHRCVAAVLAAERWAKNPKAYPGWTEEPFLESLVVFGVSENPIIVQTLDNVRPRTLADTIYTSEIFRRMSGKAVTSKDRKELSKMLDAATDLLWRRTSAGGDNEPEHRYQTHGSSFSFIDRHPKLQNCVKHLFEENANRQISLLQLSAGQCAACMYLMGSAATDPDEYWPKRNEKALDWSLWQKAEEFFTALADGSDRSFKVVQQALGQLKSIEEGLGGRVSEKLAVLAAAWHRFREDEEIKPEDLTLSYGTDKNANPVLLDPPTFGGIDLGQDSTPPETVSPAQAEKAKEAARQKKTEAALNKVKKGAGGSATQVLDDLRKEYPGLVFFFRSDNGDYNLYGSDAEAVAKSMASEPKVGPGGIPTITIEQTYYETMIKQIMREDMKPAVVGWTDGKAMVTPVAPRKQEAKPTPTKPAAKPTVTKPTVKPSTKPAPAPKKKPVLRGGTN